MAAVAGVIAGLAVEHMTTVILLEDCSTTSLQPESNAET